MNAASSMHNSKEKSSNYSKPSGSLQQYYGDDPIDNTTQSESFKYKIKITGKTPATGNTKDVKKQAPLKYLSNFWRTLEILLISCEIDLILTQFEDCVVSSANGNEKFEITDTKLYVPVITLSIEDNLKPPDQLKSCFKRAINWNKYQPKASPEKQNQYLDSLINASFQGVNILFVLLYENGNDTKVYTGYYNAKKEKKLQRCD